MKMIGPAGAIAGLMARTDAARGVWKAPAGMEADLKNILGLEVKLTDMENGVLNKLAVTACGNFPVHLFAGALAQWTDMMTRVWTGNTSPLGGWPSF